MDWMGLALMKRISKDLLYPQFVAAKALQGLQSCLKALQLRQGTSSLDLWVWLFGCDFLHDLIVEVHHNVWWNHIT
jgi:hypothetical protein